MISLADVYFWTWIRVKHSLPLREAHSLAIRQFLGDIDGDADVDLADLSGFQNCFEPQLAASPICAAFDPNRDSVVNLADYALLQRLPSGPRSPG